MPCENPVADPPPEDLSEVDGPTPNLGSDTGPSASGPMKGSPVPGKTARPSVVEAPELTLLESVSPINRFRLLPFPGSHLVLSGSSIIIVENYSGKL